MTWNDLDGSMVPFIVLKKGGGQMPSLDVVCVINIFCSAFQTNQRHLTMAISEAGWQLTENDQT